VLAYLPWDNRRIAATSGDLCWTIDSKSPTELWIRLLPITMRMSTILIRESHPQGTAP